MSSYSSHPPGVLLCLWALPGLAQAPHHPRRGRVHLLPNKPTSVHSTRLSVRTRSPPGFSSVLRFLHSQKLLPVVSLSSTPTPGAVYTTDAQLEFPYRIHAGTSDAHRSSLNQNYIGQGRGQALGRRRNTGSGGSQPGANQFPRGLCNVWEHF